MNQSHRYVALLRAINVAGNTMKMADLRVAFESFGVTDVSTHIQTGNVLFRSQEGDAGHLKRGLEEHLEAALAYQGMVFVLTREELAAAAANNPFEPERLQQDQRCHLTFLSAEPDPVRCRALMALQGEAARFAVRGKVLYYAYPRTFQGWRRTVDFEKALGVVGTARTWTVVAKLIELLA